MHAEQRSRRTTPWLGRAVTKRYEGDDSTFDNAAGTDRAEVRGRTVVSVRDDWATVFADRRESAAPARRDRVPPPVPPAGAHRSGCAIDSTATVTASSSGTSQAGSTSTPYVSRTRNHFFETSATFRPSASMAYS